MPKKTLNDRYIKPWQESRYNDLDLSDYRSSHQPWSSTKYPWTPKKSFCDTRLNSKSNLLNLSSTVERLYYTDIKCKEAVLSDNSPPLYLRRNSPGPLGLARDFNLWSPTKKFQVIAVQSLI